MLCLVTGAAGFIGSTLCDRLLSAGHTVRALDCFVDYYPRQLKEQNIATARGHSKFEFTEANLLDVDLAPLLDGVDWIFHQAAQAGVRASWGGNFSTYTENNITATQRLLEAIRTGGKAIAPKRIVYASSSSIYGDAEKFPTVEEVIPSPVSPYGVTKLAAEHLMRVYAKEFSLPTVSLRYFTVFGPRQRPDMAFRRFLEAAVKGEQLVVYGDGEQSRDFTFVDDIVQANISAANLGQPGAVYNIGGGVQATINQVLAILRGMVGKLDVKHLMRQAGDARHTSADCTAAKKELQFVPTVSLEEGIGREYEWVKALK